MRRKILEVALWHRYTVVVFLLLLVTLLGFYLFLDPPPKHEMIYVRGNLSPLVLACIYLFVMHGFYKLVASLRVTRFPILIAMLLLTGVGLLLVPFCLARAIQYLRSFGFDVSWFGTSPTKLDKLIVITPE